MYFIYFTLLFSDPNAETVSIAKNIFFKKKTQHGVRIMYACGCINCNTLRRFPIGFVTDCVYEHASVLMHWKRKSHREIRTLYRTVDKIKIYGMFKNKKKKKKHRKTKEKIMIKKNRMDATKKQLWKNVWNLLSFNGWENIFRHYNNLNAAWECGKCATQFFVRRSNCARRPVYGGERVE